MSEKLSPCDDCPDLDCGVSEDGGDCPDKPHPCTGMCVFLDVCTGEPGWRDCPDRSLVLVVRRPG